MKLKNFLTLAIVAVLIIASVISAGAVEHINTGTYYMNGYELYGSLTVYPVHAEGHTYCENINAYKSAYTTFIYTNLNGQTKIAVDGSQDLEQNFQTSLTATTPSNIGSNFSDFLAAQTFSAVKFSHYYWKANDTDTPLYIGPNAPTSNMINLNQ